MSLCEECKEAQSLYQCPRCAKKTCSLKCCKAHKDRAGCTGKRNRTKFLPLARMSDVTLQSDYFFLEDVLRNVDGGKRLLKNVGAAASSSLSSAYSHQSNHKKPRVNRANDNGSAADTTQDTDSVHAILRLKQEQGDEPPDAGEQPQAANKRQKLHVSKCQQLVHQAKTRGTTLLLMPPGMQRHVSNTSWYHMKTDTIHWKVDFCVHNITTTTTKTTTLPTTRLLISIPKLDENANLAEQLTRACPEYCASNKKDYHWLIKKLPCPSNRPTYVELDQTHTSTLKTALQDLTVIEYPTIEVVPTQDLARFPRSIEEVEQVDS